MKNRRGFTLVELLVVIGIIALLVGILLPSLNAARRQARATKCAAALREIGSGFTFYANEYKGWFPPAQLTAATNGAYDLYGDAFPISGTGAYWFNFIGKFLHKNAKLGVTSTSNVEAADQRFTTLWGCPEWEGYQSTALGGTNRVQPGFGMNMWPTFNPGYPTTNFPPSSESTFVTWNPTTRTFTGRWPKQKDYGNKGTERMLIADSRFWLSESNPAPTTNFPPDQPNINNSQTYTPGVSGQTTVDVFRHGKRPGPGTVANTVSSKQGKAGYNILFADGHVEMVQGDQAPAYKTIRMRFPN
jgi:prepilin-type N-terminal cleavage/methylation domain-containing protein/prepilin-type processing-associated H-X9-DG protein